MLAGTITAPDLLELYLERIARVDREVVLPDRAGRQGAAGGRGQQESLDAGSGCRCCVPIAIKDDVDVADEFTRYGSGAHGPAPDRRRRGGAGGCARRGAVILGKTAVPR